VFVLLVGPKGSGKSHIGRILERRLGVHFFHVEPLWMAYYAECRSKGQAPSIPEGIRVVHPKIRETLSVSRHVCVETTGASPEILGDLMSLAPARDTLVVRVSAPLELCLERVASRDQTHQIPMDSENITKVYQLSTSAAVNAALMLENSTLSEEEVVRLVGGALSGRGDR
jgi:dephospho-CoA kinase